MTDVEDTATASELTLDEALPTARFRELHHQVIAAPIEQVWPHCLEVTSREIRPLGPLLALRGLPATLRGRRPSGATHRKPLLDVFTDAGFVMLRQDDEPADGRAVVLVGAAGRFWSPSENAPIPFSRAVDFLTFDEPGFAKTVARLEATDLGDGTTRVETETVVAGTDAISTLRFAPYWAVIRLPSGLIRRSWLAAIDRRSGA